MGWLAGLGGSLRLGVGVVLLGWAAGGCEMPKRNFVNYPLEPDAGADAATSDEERSVSATGDASTAISSDTSAERDATSEAHSTSDSDESSDPDAGALEEIDPEVPLPGEAPQPDAGGSSTTSEDPCPANATGCAPGLLGLDVRYAVSIEPSFDARTTRYQVVVPLHVQNLQLTPTLAEGVHATVRGATVLSDALWTSPPLSLGENTLELQIEVPDHAVATYTLQVTRGADPITYLKASNADPGDKFSSALAISADGRTLAVGALGESSSATGVGGDEDDNSRFSGAVYVFVRDASGWRQQAYIKPSEERNNDLFGYSLALSADGNTLAIGGGNQANRVVIPGIVEIYTRLGTGWSHHTRLQAPNAESHDLFGGSMILSDNGEMLVVGAAELNRTYVFERSGSDWALRASLSPPNPDLGSSFGHVVALAEDGTTLAVGGYQSRVEVFVKDSSGWSPQATLEAPNSETTFSGHVKLSLSADGSTLAVGVALESANNNAVSVGAAYIFVRHGSAWSQQARLASPTATERSAFGSSLSLSADGHLLAVGALGETAPAGDVGGVAPEPLPGSGSAFVFLRTGDRWTQQAHIKPIRPGEGHVFGHTLALSGDGQTLAVGASEEDSTARGVGGNPDDVGSPRSGAVYVYR